MYLFTYIYVSHIAGKNYHISSVRQPARRQQPAASSQQTGNEIPCLKAKVV
ncbi:MAG: hypothetical protein V7K77_01755 [Nostoc sp.]|uniref:hypothetical protein n=1 Tax=Nostoc sp. TaxID=1180 RepID=UPI002FF8357C